MPPVRRTRTIAPVPQSEQAAEVLGEVPPALRAKREARRVQAAAGDPKLKVAGVDQDSDGVLRAEIAGKKFRLADSVGMMALMELAVAADDVDALAGAQLVALFRMLQSVVHEDDWAAFRKHTREAKCDDEEFAAFQNAALEALAARPTEEPGNS